MAATFAVPGCQESGAYRDLPMQFSWMPRTINHVLRGAVFQRLLCAASIRRCGAAPEGAADPSPVIVGALLVLVLLPWELMVHDRIRGKGKTIPPGGAA